MELTREIRGSPRRPSRFSPLRRKSWTCSHARPTFAPPPSSGRPQVTYRMYLPRQSKITWRELPVQLVYEARNLNSGALFKSTN